MHGFGRVWVSLATGPGDGKLLPTKSPVFPRVNSFELFTMHTDVRTTRDQIGVRDSTAPHRTKRRDGAQPFRCRAPPNRL